MRRRVAKQTIVDAITAVMRAKGQPMAIREVYDAIISTGLYSFRADDPVHIVANQIRRHCEGLDFPSASPSKHFVLIQDGKYYVRSSAANVAPAPNTTSEPLTKTALHALQCLHQEYLQEFRCRALDRVKQLEPIMFERFCRNLLVAFGFRDVVVTRVVRDGGIDGYGHLKVGFAYFNVAFQCKHWAKQIGRPEIDRFRGAIQGRYEQGVFFTTAGYSSEAKKSSLRAGAVPVILIDGPTIVDIMIQQGFGIELTSLPIYTLALDLALSDEQ